MEKIGVFCASSNNLEPVFYSEAGRLGKWIGEHELTLIYGGHNEGLMEAVAQGVKSTGKGIVVGVIPKTLIDKGAVSECVGIRVPTEDLSDRKMWLMKLSDVMIAMPGSVGTLDEAFSAIAQNAIGLSEKKIIFWNINGFWNDLFTLLDGLKAKGVVNKPLEQIVMKADSFEELTEILEKL